MKQSARSLPFALICCVTACGPSAPMAARTVTPPAAAPDAPREVAVETPAAPALPTPPPVECELLVYETPRMTATPEGTKLGEANDCPPLARRSCRADQGCEKATIDGHTVTVLRDGPLGSGRVWSVAVHIDDARVCFLSSTVGWRRIGGSSHARGLAPFSWLQDLDADGTVELVVWSSAPAYANAGNIDHVLLPVTYRIEGRDLVRDLRPSAALLHTVAAIYEDPRVAQTHCGPDGEPCEARDGFATLPARLRALATADCPD